MKCPQLDRFDLKLYEELLIAGVPFIEAAQTMGVGNRTLSSWNKIGETAMNEAKTDDPEQVTGEYQKKCARVYHTTVTGYAKFIRSGVIAVQKIGRESKNWIPIMTMLERRCPEHFGKRLDIKGRVEVEIMGKRYSEETVKEFQELLAPILAILEDVLATKHPNLMKTIGKRIESVYSVGSSN